MLGIWVQTSEGAKFWAGVLAELRNRGVQDVLIACVDGLTGFPEAIEATWPQHRGTDLRSDLIRASMRFISHDDRKKVAAALLTHPYRPHRRGRREGVGHLRRLDLGQETPGHGASVAGRLGTVYPVLGVPT